MRNVARKLGAITLALGFTVISDDASTQSLSAEEGPLSKQSVLKSSLRTTPITRNFARQRLQNTLTAQNAFLINMERRPDRNETKRDTRAVVPFANFVVNVKPEEEGLDVEGAFTLGAASDGINLFKEEVAVKLGTLATTIKAGSFKRKTSGKVSFKKVIDCTYWELEFRPLGNNNFEFKAQLLGVKGITKVSPEDVALSIGNDGGPARAQ